jgi:methyltransferase
MIAEYFYLGGEFSIIMMVIFLLLISLKIWTIGSLGKYWNTKILRIPNSIFIKKGPYKLFKHPNYFIVICEIIVIPLVFHLYATAIVFSLLNA